LCRLFGLSGGTRRVHATFWLLQAPDSLTEQSRRNPDGYGLGIFAEDGTPELDKAPVAAYEDAAFAAEARAACSGTFVAHVRFASVGAVAPENTHPFLRDGRFLAHNGHVGGLEALEGELGPDEMAAVRGATDSERVFALVLREAARHGGDVTEGLRAAARWIGAHLPLYALNLVVTSATELWALRYPDIHELWVLDRACGTPFSGMRGTIRVASPELDSCDGVVVASEPMDDDPNWRLMEAGELVHVDAEGRLSASTGWIDPPVQPLSLAQLEPTAAAAQTEARTA
jgi:predicted glutamine amidotransferase